MTHNELTIRLATPDDLAAISDFNQQMAAETEHRQLDLPVVRAGVLAVLQDPAKGVYYIAARAATPVGQMLVTREWSDWRNAWFWWIQSVYTLPAERGRGVYRALHAAVERDARAAADVCGLRLYVDHENVGAQAVYEKLGMHRTNYDFFEVDWHRT